MEAGDEGCWGLKMLGNWHNLVVGMEERLEAGYALPMSEVYADIEKNLGVRIVEPELEW